jgi:hypothetical protein
MWSPKPPSVVASRVAKKDEGSLFWVRTVTYRHATWLVVTRWVRGDLEIHPTFLFVASRTYHVHRIAWLSWFINSIIAVVVVVVVVVVANNPKKLQQIKMIAFWFGSGPAVSCCCCWEWFTFFGQTSFLLHPATRE